MIHVLLIDDEHDLREEVAENLRFESFEVTTATDGSHGVELALQIHPDIIVCDVRMPQLDGYGVLLELRSNPETMHIPFIFLTAKASVTDFRAGMQLGADDYLTKPFHHNELVAAIHTRLEKQQQVTLHMEEQLKQFQHSINREQARHESLVQFLNMVSHDLKTYLASINSSAQLVHRYHESISPEKRAHHLERIVSRVHTMSSMLDDLVTVGQSQTGSMNLQTQPIDFLALIEEVIADVEPLSPSHIIRFQNNTNSILLPELDPRLMRQVLINLLSNAMKYSPGSSEIFITLEANEHKFALHVTDYGIGIPEQDVERLFRTFERASNVGTIPGTGIGLTLVHTVVSLHGGTVSVRSQVNEGTTLSLYLPMKQPNPTLAE